MTHFVLGIRHYPLLNPEFKVVAHTFDPVAHLSAHTLELKNPDRVRILRPLPDGRHVIALPEGLETPVVIALRHLKPV